MRNISYEFEKVTEKKLSDVNEGVYVICVSNPFTISYASACSEIIYIGIGKISNRLESHFYKNLFDFMLSVAGANFDFYLTEPKNSIGELFYKHIEFMLLDKFAEKYGSYPLLNINAGSKKDFDDAATGWDKPLKASGKKPIWEIKPTKHSAFGVLD